MSIFLDHAATSPLRPEAMIALQQALEVLGNPSSVHSDGQRTRAILEDARDKISKAAGCNRSEVIFTSGGTESNNEAIKGLYWEAHQKDSNRNIILTSAQEHHAALDPAIWLAAEQGAKLHYVELETNGMVKLNELEEFIEANHQKIALISLIWVNNETGVITDIPRIAKKAKELGISMHSDAVAAFGNIPISFHDSELTSMAISGHKVGAPIGVGALIVARSAKPASLLHGGGQERGLRSGTMNYPLAAAFAAAATAAQLDMQERAARLALLRDRLEREVLGAIPSTLITALGADRVNHNCHLVFDAVQSDSLLFLLDQRGISVSAGSACQAGVLAPSHVLLAMGYQEAQAAACLIITLGRTTTESEVEAFTQAIVPVYQQSLRAGLSSRVV
jgi:cysteine desulfurase